jgi:hypothetical protein
VAFDDLGVNASCGGCVSSQLDDESLECVVDAERLMEFLILREWYVI